MTSKTIPARGSPPRPKNLSKTVHTGPAVREGAVPKYLLDRHVSEAASFPELTVERPTEDTFIDCDVVIVGSGAGGAPVAAELSALGFRVVIVEQGAHFTKKDFVGTPIERAMKLYTDGGATQSFGNVVVSIPTGRTVGGTTTVNSGTCFRTPNKVLSAWSSMGVAGVEPLAMDPYFRSVEDVLNVRPVPWELLGPTGWITHKGASRVGATGGPILRNIGSCHGTGQCAFGCPTDAKQAMHLSYLPKAQQSGARILAETRVDWVVIDDKGNASGVVARCCDAEVRIRANVVVIAAGAIGTPTLLMRNRICNSSGQLGRNLRIHPATGVAGWFDDPVFGWRGTLQPYYVDSLFDKHDVMLEATNSVPSIGAGAINGFGLEAKESIARYAHMATLGLLVSDTSAGRVRLLPKGKSFVTYSMNAHDAANLYEGLALATEILLEAGADHVTASLPGLQEIYDSEGVEELRAGRWGPRALKLSAFHPMGTARMGPDPRSCVVNSSLESHDVHGLFITDASVFPSCLGVNPQVTIMAFALKAAMAIAERL